MKKIFLLLLVGLVLIGGGCGNGGENGENGDVDVNKDIGEAGIRSVLSKTAADLGWSGVSVEKAGSKGYQIKHGTETLGITKVTDSDVAMFVPGATRSTFAKKYCAALPQTKEERGGSESNLMKLSGFDACYGKNYMVTWRDLPDCQDNNSTMTVIGSYWLQAISTVNKEGRNVACESQNTIPMAEALVKNLLEVLK